MEPSATCTVTVAFAPGTIGAKNAALTVTHNAATSPDAVTLTGTGTSIPAPTFAVSPSSKDYGAHSVDSTSARQTFTVTNTGTATLALTAADLAGADPAHFAKTGTHARVRALRRTRAVPLG